MTPEQLQEFLQQLQSAAPLIGVGLLALAVLLFLLALRNFRKSRTDSYWRRRRAAGQRGWRMFIWSLMLSGASGSVCIIVGVAGLVNARPLAQQTPIIVALAGSATAETSSDLPTQTPSATATKESATATPSSTPTQLVLATVTSVPTLTETLTTTSSPTPLPSTNTPNASATQTTAATDRVFSSAAAASVPTTTAAATQSPPSATNTAPPTSTATRTFTPSPTITLIPSGTATSPAPTAVAMESNPVLDTSVKITITSLAIQIATSSTPVDPGSSFTAGFTRLYFWVNFSGIKNGTLWRRQLTRDGKVIENNQYRWGQLEDGASYFFFGQEGGFLPGNYQIKLFFGDSEQPAAVAVFTVK